MTDREQTTKDAPHKTWTEIQQLYNEVRASDWEMSAQECWRQVWIKLGKDETDD